MEAKNKIFCLFYKNDCFRQFSNVASFDVKNLGLDPDPGLTKKPGSGFSEYCTYPQPGILVVFSKADGIQQTLAHKGKLRYGTRCKTKNKKFTGTVHIQ